MTVQTATKMWSRNDGTVTVESGQKYKASIREAYQVLCDPTDTLRDVSNAPGLPALNDLYPGSSQIRVTSNTPRQVSPLLWIVEIGYEGEFGPQGISQSPLSMPPIIKFGKTDTEIPVDQDANGVPLVTANGEPIEGITKSVSDITATIERNFRSINLAGIYQYFSSVNSDTFLGFAPGVVRMTEFTAEEIIAEGKGGYWKVHAGFQMRYPYNTTPQKAWYARVRNQGFLVNDGSNVKRAHDDFLQPTTRPVLLKSDGTIEPLVSNATWLEFQLYTPLPYQALGLL